MKYVYKAVAAIGTLVVIPLLYFIEMFYYKVESTALNIAFALGNIMSPEKFNEILEQTGGTVPKYMADTMSIHGIIDLITSFSSEGDFDTAPIEMLISPALTLITVGIMIVICAIVTAVVAIACKDNRKVIYCSVSGIALSVIFSECFKAVAEPILDRTVSLSTILDSTWADMIGTAQELSLSSNFWFIPAIFAAVILWTVLYNYTLSPEEKRERKLMLGEAD